MSVFAIGPPHSSAELSGVSENPRGYSDPNSEAEHLQKYSRENGNGGGQVTSPAKAVPRGNQRRKSKTKRCHEDHEKEVARENQHRVRQLPKRFSYFHILSDAAV
jgi:hypothetical protein